MDNSAAYSAAINAAGQAIGIAAQGAQSRALAKLQNQYNIDMWNRTNEYNSPQAQMNRLAAAGLNPNLIYGNINTGNTTPPQQVVPQPVDLQRGVSKIAEAFNIENLLTIDANRRRLEADADNAHINAERNRWQFAGEQIVGAKYDFDPITGSYVPRPEGEEGTRLFLHPGAYYANKILQDSFTRTHLLPYRAAMLDMQRQYLAPQVSMANYESRYYPFSYWIGQGGKITSSISDLGGMILKIPGLKGGSFRPPKTFRSPDGKIYHY